VIGRWAAHWPEWRELVDSLGWAYTGYFTVDGKRVIGYLRCVADEVHVFVHGPPRGGTYEHAPCLMLVRDGWFQVHYRCPPRTFEAAISYSQTYLNKLVRHGAS
jgi:hypothetical protein